MTLRILTVDIRYENDVVAARQRARQIGELLGFEGQDQTRIATAVSEIARNALVYGGGGKLEFGLEGSTAPQVLVATISDKGPGIPNLEEILAGNYESRTGMGLGILGARRLLDSVQIESKPGGGTKIWLRKILPARTPLIAREDLKKIADGLAGPPDGKPRTLLEELQQQNRELVQALDELRARQEELSELNAELADTNRGVIALYAELDEKADHLRRADELKSKFLSNMSHEFRTPLNSILALTRLLIDRVDGELTREQEVQVGFIRKSAEELYELVNDLLDLAKVEAGKIVIRPSEFRVSDLFGALRGMLRPLLVNPGVNLVFDEAEDLPPMRTDEGKVSQILRNFISNAFKFTQAGEIRIAARLVRAGEPLVIPHKELGEDAAAEIAGSDCILFSVEDTGIGIAPAFQERIFQEFGQLENPIQQQVRGTGLGLPLSKKLAELLGGAVRVRSEEGLGSTFAAMIPVAMADDASGSELMPEAAPVESGRSSVLVVEDSPEDRLIYARMLAGTRFQPAFAGTVLQAKDMARKSKPVAIILDIMMQGQASWSLLAEFKRDPSTRDVPVIVATTLDDKRKGLGLGADSYFVKPLDPEWLRETLDVLVREDGDCPATSILLIEDDEAHRYIMRGLLAGCGRTVLEASDGIRGLEMAAAHCPAVILLDLGLPGIPGDRVLRLLKADARTAQIPVVIVTSDTLSRERRQALERHAAVVLGKAQLSRAELLAAVNRAAGAGPPGRERVRTESEETPTSANGDSGSSGFLYNESTPAGSGETRGPT